MTESTPQPKAVPSDKETSCFLVKGTPRSSVMNKLTSLLIGGTIALNPFFPQQAIALPKCPSWGNTVEAVNANDIPKIRRLGYEVSQCDRSVIQRNLTRATVPVILVKVKVPAGTGPNDTEVLLASQRSAVAALKKNGISAKLGGL